MQLLTGSLSLEILPKSPARGGWEILPSKVEAAIEEMGIRYHVRIRYSDGYYKVGGHGIRKNIIRGYGLRVWHRIVLSQDRGIEEANETLWHELRHAQQTEEWARSSGVDSIPPQMMMLFYRQAYKQAKGPHGASYRENRYEVDCREFAAANSYRKLLR